MEIRTINKSKLEKANLVCVDSSEETARRAGRFGDTGEK